MNPPNISWGNKINGTIEIAAISLFEDEDISSPRLIPQVAEHNKIPQAKNIFDVSPSINQVIPANSIVCSIANKNWYRNIEERFESLITKSAEERYVDLVQNNRKIIQFIPLKMIACYLGITDVALSRIRSRLAKKGNINH